MAVRSGDPPLVPIFTVFGQFFSHMLLDEGAAAQTETEVNKGRITYMGEILLEQVDGAVDWDAQQLSMMQHIRTMVHLPDVTLFYKADMLSIARPAAPEREFLQAVASAPDLGGWEILAMRQLTIDDGSSNVR